MPLYPFYTYPIGAGIDSFWLIRKDLGKKDQWLLVMCGPEHRKLELGFFDAPEKAAYAIANFKTGNRDWDTMPQVFSAGAEEIQHSPIRDLTAWKRTDDPND
jgi:hypothetical protein